MSPALTSSSCLDVSSSDESVDPNEDENQHHHHTSFRLRLSKKSVKRMAKKSLRKLTEWLLEVEMGFVWGVAGLAIITFVFAAIWYIDPALLTLVLRFRQARCVTRNHAFLIGISNCSWTSCRLGCTREIYQCWQIQVLEKQGVPRVLKGSYWSTKDPIKFLKKRSSEGPLRLLLGS